MSARSYLYVPGDQPDKLMTASTRGADAIIADLEDAVPLANKHIARDAVVDWLASDASAAEHWVRINNGDQLEQDIVAVMGAEQLTGISLPKASLEAMAKVDAILGDKRTPVIALIETAEGVLDARAIASIARVQRLAIGEVDLSADLSMEPSADLHELWPMRAQVLLASAAALIDPPVAPISTDFKDLAALETSTRSLKRAGFGARAAIHPAQIAVINKAFTPTPEEVAAATSLLALFEAAGGGVCVDEEGRMVDEAVVRAARRTLSMQDGSTS